MRGTVQRVGRLRRLSRSCTGRTGHGLTLIRLLLVVSSSASGVMRGKRTCISRGARVTRGISRCVFGRCQSSFGVSSVTSTLGLDGSCLSRTFGRVAKGAVVTCTVKCQLSRTYATLLVRPAGSVGVVSNRYKFRDSTRFDECFGRGVNAAPDGCEGGGEVDVRGKR